LENGEAGRGVKTETYIIFEGALMSAAIIHKMGEQRIFEGFPIHTLYVISQPTP
jgi:hypothetical protein